jgi:hypothetical protein
MLKKRCVALILALVVSLSFAVPFGVSANAEATETGAVAETVDLSSPETFIVGIGETYGIIIMDKYDYLSSDSGKEFMLEIERCLSLFSAGFIRKLVDFYGSHGYPFIISLDEPSETEYASITISEDVTILLHYDDDPVFNGIKADKLAHELGHAIHIVAETRVGSRRVRDDMKKFNGNFAYVGDRYAKAWRERTHGTAFAYYYGMHSYEEDIACFFQMLVADPAGMESRLSDSRNSALLQKTVYIRNFTYKYISDECGAVFEPLEKALLKNVAAATTATTKTKTARTPLTATPTAA